MKRRKPRPQSDHIEPKWLSPTGELQSCRRSPVFPRDLGGKASNAPVVWRLSAGLWQDAANAMNLPAAQKESLPVQACQQGLPRAARSTQIQPY